MIIPMIQRRSDDGSSSSSKSFTAINLSLHDGKIEAKISAMMKSPSTLKIVMDTGFCEMSESEESKVFVIEENIVSTVYRYNTSSATVARKRNVSKYMYEKVEVGIRKKCDF